MSHHPPPPLDFIYWKGTWKSSPHSRRGGLGSPFKKRVAKICVHVVKPLQWTIELGDRNVFLAHLVPGKNKCRLTEPQFFLQTLKVSCWGGGVCNMTFWSQKGLSVTHIIFFLIYFLLKDNCFTELCCFLSHLDMNQPQVDISPLLSESPSHLPPPPTPLDWYSAPVWVWSESEGESWILCFNAYIQT